MASRNRTRTKGGQILNSRGVMVDYDMPTEEDVNALAPHLGDESDCEMCLDEHFASGANKNVNKNKRQVSVKKRTPRRHGTVKQGRYSESSASRVSSVEPNYESDEDNDVEAEFTYPNDAEQHCIQQTISTSNEEPELEEDNSKHGGEDEVSEDDLSVSEKSLAEIVKAAIDNEVTPNMLEFLKTKYVKSIRDPINKKVSDRLDSWKKEVMPKVDGCSTAMKGVHESMEKLITKVDAYHKDLTEYLKQDQADKKQMRDDLAKMKKNQAEFANWMAKRVGQISQPQPNPFLADKMKVPSSICVSEKPADSTKKPKKKSAAVAKKSSGASVAKQAKKRRITANN